MKAKNLSAILLLTLSIPCILLFLGCHLSTTTKKTATAPKLDIQAIPLVSSDDLSTAGNDNLSTDSFISLKYTVINERRAYKFDDRNNNKQYLAEVDSYDRHKNLIEHKSFHSNGDLEQQEVYQYENGLLVHMYRFNIGSRDILYKETYLYDSARKMTYSTFANYQRRLKIDTVDKWKCIVSDADYEGTKTWGGKSTKTYKYDSKGRLAETNETSQNSTNETETYTYDDEGRVIEESTITDGTISRRITTRHFQDSLESTCIFYPYHPWNVCYKTFNRDKQLLVEHCIETDANKPMFTRKYFYDSKKRVIREEYITNIGNTIPTLYKYKEYAIPIQKTFAVNNR